jgi:D-alanyl-D-alanine-carboxypeptidase/D-alanyl-D-alanine-endopeptidase
MRCAVTMLAVSWLITGVALAAAAPAESAIREAARQWVLDEDGIGLTIGIYDAGQRLFFNFGTSHLDTGRLPTKDTVYEIGSISKPIAGQLLARAVVEGRATLQDEVSRHLEEPYPNLQNGGQPIRLRHLVSSTSQLLDNIPDFTQVRPVPGEPLAITRMRVLENYSRSEFLRQLHRVMPHRAPGGEPAFSNVGSMLLGVALEKIYGEPFEAILAREIERPLRMGSGTAPAVKLLARGHTADNVPLPPFAARIQYPSLALRYSADDLLKFAAWQLVERDASVKLAHQPTWATPDGRQSVGFFWIMGDSAYGLRLMQSGSTYGFTSLCELYPEAKVAVVLLSNKSADGAQESLRALSARIIALLRPEELRPPLSSAGVRQRAR